MWTRTAIVLLLLTGGCAHSDPSAATKPVGSSAAAFFRDDLARHGLWTTHPSLGDCWYPSNVPPGWKPNTQGRWIYTDDDHWLWAGTEAWSWATDHYGHWSWQDSHGWLWSPGEIWSHNTVTWHVADDFVGWAPTPRHSSDVVPPFAYTFVAEKSLLDVKVAEQAIAVTRNVTLLKLPTDSKTPTVDQLEAVLEKPVRRYHIVDLLAVQLPRLSDDEISIYRPMVTDVIAGSHGDAGSQQPFNADQAAEQRMKLDDYHRQLRAAMDQRQSEETKSPPTGVSSDQLSSAHGQELAAYEDQRQRDVESLRRRQRDERQRADQLAAAAQEESARTSSKPQENNKFDLPPEWQVPPEMLNTSPKPSK